MTELQRSVDRIAKNVSDTYSVLSELGADIPDKQNSGNLAPTAETVADRVDYQTELIDQLFQLLENKSLSGTDAEDRLFLRALTTYSNDRVTVTGAYALALCDPLIAVNLPNVVNIAEGSFYFCTNLKTVDIPNAQMIGESAFTGCAFEEVDFPKVTIVDEDAFLSCGLKSVNLPAATRIGAYAFTGCEDLETVDLPAAETVGTGAFSECDHLVSASLPRVTTISDRMFNDCVSLVDVSIPEATTVGSYAFRYDRSLVSVDLPKVTEVGSNAFYEAKGLTYMDLPKVTSIGASAFYYCSALETVILRSEAMATLGNTSVFDKTPIAEGTGYVYVLSTLVDTYKADSRWSEYANQIRAIEDYPEITGGVA